MGFSHPILFVKVRWKSPQEVQGADFSAVQFSKKAYILSLPNFLLLFSVFVVIAKIKCLIGLKG